jgi:Mn2+/Fe2+ NRAMP family transporter
MSTGDRNQKLSQAFHFTSADLTLNKQGKIAESQKANVNKYRRGRVISLVAFAVMGGLFLLGLLGVGVSTLFNSGDNTIGYAIMGALAVALLAMGGGAAYFYFRSRDLISGLISQAVGAAKRISREARDEDGSFGMVYFVKLGSKQFRMISEEQHNAFEEGKNYRAYYVKAYPFDVILSLEGF